MKVFNKMLSVIVFLLIIAIAVTGCSADEDQEPAIDISVEKTAEPRLKDMVPDVREIAGDSEYVILSGNSEDAYSYMITDISSEAFKSLNNELIDGYFPNVYTNMDELFIAHNEYHTVTVSTAYYEGSDTSESYLVLTVRPYDIEEAESDA